MFVIYDGQSMAWVGFMGHPVSSLFDAIKFKTSRQASEYIRKNFRGLLGFEVSKWKGE